MVKVDAANQPIATINEGDVVLFLILEPTEDEN